MQLQTIPKVAILCACLLLFACKSKDYEKAIVGSWQMEALYLVSSEDSISKEQISGIVYEFYDNGTFRQSLPDGQELPGRFAIMGDTLLLTDTVRNVSFAHAIQELDKKALTLSVFNSFFNEEMEMQFRKIKNK
jgi:hypothetical protein